MTFRTMCDGACSIGSTGPDCVRALIEPTSFLV